MSNFSVHTNNLFQLPVDKMNFLAEISSRRGPTQCPYPVCGPKIAHRPYANEILNFSSSTVGSSSTFLSVLSKQNNPCWQEMDRLRNEIGPRPHTNEISKFLVGPSSRWGLTQCLYPVWGPKIAHRLHGKEISNCLSSSVSY